MKKGDLIELEITGYAFEGKGIAKVNKNIIKPNTPDNGDKNNNYIIFVNGFYPGDRVKAKLLKIKGSYAEAKTIEILTAANSRVEAKCKFFGTCGGCRQQDLNYDKQLVYKQKQVWEIFEHVGGLTDYKFDSIIPSGNIFFYRNKMEFSFSDKRWLTKDELTLDEIPDRNFALGLHIPKIFDKVLDIDECFLQSELSNMILNFTREFFKSKNISVYSTRTHTGFLRNLVIRQSANTDDLMVNLVTAGEDSLLLDAYKNKLVEEIPAITTVINNINQKKASVAIGDYEKVLYGDGFIYDKIGKYKFRISANSFFQTNTVQAEQLYKTALGFAELNGDEIVYDLYAGAGTISIYVSEFAKEVHAFESVESSISDAKINAGLNKVKNVHFHKADLYKSFLPIVQEKRLPKPDVMIIDPPRSGMHKNTVSDVIKLEPEKIVYVSCNPATQARDVSLMVDAGYELLKMRPVDMFPHTYHIENVALLKK